MEINVIASLDDLTGLLDPSYFTQKNSKNIFLYHYEIIIDTVLKDETSTIFFWSDSTYMYVGRKGLQGSKILTDSIVI